MHADTQHYRCYPTTHGSGLVFPRRTEAVQYIYVKVLDINTLLAAILHGQTFVDT